MEVASELYRNGKTSFNDRLALLVDTKKDNSVIMSKQKYIQLIVKVKESKLKMEGKTPADYNRLKRYDIMEVGGCEKLFLPVNGEDTSVQYYVHVEEIFDIMNDTHLAIGHGGRTRMFKELQKKYRNITLQQIMIYLNLCETCQKKSSIKKKGLVIRPIISNEMNSRCQIDLIDMQSQADNDYKFIYVYQDHLTKFVQLRPLKTKTAEEVAYVTLDIFTIFGAPSILQSDNGREFSNRVVEEICAMWEGLKIVHGKPRHSQSQGSVERANQDVENMLSSWLIDNKTTHWVQGLRFVQFMKNRAFHRGIKRSPYEAMFGFPAKVGLKSSNLPDELELDTEEQLEELLRASPEENEENVENEENEENIIEEIDNNDDIVHEDPESILTLNKNQENIKKKRESSKEALENQAKKMKQLSEKNFPQGKVGDTVKVRVPDVDRARSDSRNIIAIILAVINDNYQLGTKEGRLAQLYTRNQFVICKEKFISKEDVPDIEISLRACARNTSISGGQGYTRCTCKGRCNTNKCSCKRNAKLCNSKCHSSLPCFNK